MLQLEKGAAAKKVKKPTSPQAFAGPVDEAAHEKKTSSETKKQPTGLNQPTRPARTEQTQTKAAPKHHGTKPGSVLKTG